MNGLANLMKDSSFSERLALALDKEGFPPKNKGRIQLLAELMALTHRGASKWLNGETKPPAKKLLILADKLNVDAHWLGKGEGTMEQPEPKININQEQQQAIPVYAIEDILSPNKTAIKQVNCDIHCDMEIFAITLDSQAMSPRFPAGSTVIFKADDKINDGDFVLVKTQMYPVPIFRQVVYMGSYKYLYAHNPKFEKLQLQADDDILGIVLQAIISF